MANDIVKELFSTILSEEKLYKPLIANYGKYGEQLDSAYSELGLTLEQRRPIDEIVMDISYMSEQHGFEQGLRLGLRLSAFAFGDTEK